MQILKQLVEKDINNFVVGKRKNRMQIYDFFKALSRASAYLKLKDADLLNKKDRKWISRLWKALVWDSLQESILVNNRADFPNKDDWIKEVRKTHSLTKKVYLDELLKIVDEKEGIIMRFNNEFMIEESKKVKKLPESYGDIKLKYSIGILVRK